MFQCDLQSNLIWWESSWLYLRNVVVTQFPEHLKKTCNSIISNLKDKMDMDVLKSVNHGNRKD